jgi:hypothetical protein
MHDELLGLIVCSRDVPRLYMRTAQQEALEVVVMAEVAFLVSLGHGALKPSASPRAKHRSACSCSSFVPTHAALAAATSTGQDQLLPPPSNPAAPPQSTILVIEHQY